MVKQKRWKRKRRSRGNYDDKAIAMMNTGDLPVVPGGMTFVAVLHDDNCPFLISGGRDQCTCNPEIVPQTLARMRRVPDVQELIFYHCED